MANFVNTRNNFPDAQKLSGRQCRRADEVFGTLTSISDAFIEVNSGLILPISLFWNIVYRRGPVVIDSLKSDIERLLKQ